MRSKRVDLIDALRAAALFGILQVNIQSFAWGAGEPLGYFVTPPDATDGAVYLLTAIFIQGKFIALFAVLFGVGFALQMRSLRRSGLALPQAKAVYRRRLVFLLAVGVAHGTLLYYGDILTAYALAGFVLLLHAGLRPAALARACRRWWIAYAVLLLASLSLYATLPEGDEALPAALRERFALYATAGYAVQLPARIEDYLATTLSAATFGLPMLLGLFTLGALAGRLGWLTQPQRHRRLWRAAAWLGGAALPLALAGAWLAWRAATEAPGGVSAAGFVLTAAGMPLLALYLAAVVRWRATAPVVAAIHWLAPAGRMPLTNYLLQSVLMGALLSGWGLGAAAFLSRSQLALLAVAIVGVQIAASRVWMARFGSGPVEALWQAWTYGPSRR